MTARILDGAELARRCNDALAVRVSALAVPPSLAVVLVGADPASQIYVRNKARVAEKLGFRHQQITLPADTGELELIAAVDALNADRSVDAILVQLPLPRHLDANRVIDRIDPAKDADGCTPASVGLLHLGRPDLVACTPAGCLRLLEDAGVPLTGRDAVVVGRSNIVGRPVARLLELANCSVDHCHSRTRDLAGHVRRAEIVIAAVGVPELIRGDWLADGAVVIDVGINRGLDGKLKGDVAFAEAVPRVSMITPVPGGVGPMTIAMLMENTFRAASRRR